MKVGVEGSLIFIKRVVAVAGDTIALRDGRAIVNGRSRTEPYVRPCPIGAPTCNFTEELRVPPGTLYLLGDNRNMSLDSRFFGPIPSRWVIGTVNR